MSVFWIIILAALGGLFLGLYLDWRVKNKDKSFDKWIMHRTGSTALGMEGNVPEAKAFRYRMARQKVIPLKGQDRSKGYQLFASNNDGFELWFGWDNHWNYHINQYEVRALFWWILWEWYAKARWFGIRRPVYYWALRRHINRNRKKAGML
jgi:hypothetical protein